MMPVKPTMIFLKSTSALLRELMHQPICGLLTSLVLTLCLAGCSDSVRMPTPEQMAAFEAVEPIAPTVDMERVRKAKLHTGPYRVVPGDVLEFAMSSLLRVATETEAQATRTPDGRDEPFICRVSDAGTITLPVVGELEVSGASLGDVENTVIKAYEAYVVHRPSVYARVLEYSTAKVYIAGAVQTPGVYTLRADQMTLVSLLTEAGGISAGGAAVVRVIGSEAQENTLEDAVQSLQARASPRTISPPSSPTKAPMRPVRRHWPVPSWTSVHMAARPPSVAQAPSRKTRGASATTGDSTVIAPAAAGVSHPGDPSRAEPESIASADPPVPGETPNPEEKLTNRTVVLPVVGMNIPFKDVAITEGDTVVVEPIQMPMVSVLGLVRSPGNFAYPPYTRYNLAQVIALAGGLDMTVEPRYATVYRLRSDGAVLRLPFRLVDDGEFTENLNVSLRPGDLVSVEHTPRTRTNAFLNQFFRISVGVYYDPEEFWE